MDILYILSITSKFNRIILGGHMKIALLLVSTILIILSTLIKDDSEGNIFTQNANIFISNKKERGTDKVISHVMSFLGVLFILLAYIGGSRWRMI